MKQFNNILCLMALVLCVACAGDPPKIVGEQVATKYNNCFDVLVADINNTGNEFVKNFDKNRYQTRAAVRAEFTAKIDEVIRKYDTEHAVIEAEQAKIEQKYAKKPERLTEFRNAFDATIKPNDDKQVKEKAYINDSLNKLILTITPPAPENEQIKKDLVGQSVREPKSGYNGGNTVWKIKDGDIKQFAVDSCMQKEKEYLYKLRMTLQAQGGAAEVACSVKYVLVDQDNWVIRSITTEEFGVVKTGLYDKCIERVQGYLCWNFFNNSNRALMVGGLRLWGSKWIKFQEIVPCYDTRSVFCSEYKIHYIELKY